MEQLKPLLSIQTLDGGYIKLQLADGATSATVQSKMAAFASAQLLQAASESFNRTGKSHPPFGSKEFFSAGAAPQTAAVLPGESLSLPGQKVLVLGFGDANLMLPLSKELAQALGKQLSA